MYDLECDDDDWKDFLKKFTRPLEEVTREEEDHDPEYNILADEEIDRGKAFCVILFQILNLCCRESIIVINSVTIFTK